MLFCDVNIVGDVGKVWMWRRSLVKWWCVEQYHPKLYHIVVTFKLAVALELTENMVHVAYGLLFETLK
jgi:hypothetical protein